ncbi:MAG: diguanylate cyclase, partial [Campylobacterota bacterium]|nr:diguanylate cyclase [Campylobacterota bacterium]
EDEEGIRNQLSKFLNYFAKELFIAKDGQEGLELFKKHKPDIVVSDIKMPRMTGIEMSHAIKEINPKQHIIFTTAHSESGFFMEAIDMQVDGYILKPVNLEKLEEKLEAIKEHIELKRYYKKHQKELEEKAYMDELTEIHNRAYFEEEFDKEIARHKREKTPLSFIILDIDKFKDFNDTYGHLMGDEILKDLAKTVKEQTRRSDTFARWGGEEFVQILPNASIKNALKVAEHLRKTIEAHTFKDGLKVTCSFGVAAFTQENDTQESVMKRADDALYKAKQNGRNRVEE